METFVNLPKWRFCRKPLAICRGICYTAMAKKWKKAFELEFTIRQALSADTTAVVTFYEQVIDEMQSLPYRPKWQKGIYPAADYLSAAISAKELYLAEENGHIMGAMVVNHRAPEDYDRAAWTVAAQPAEVMVLHTLAVSPSVMNRGLGTALTEKAIALAGEMGCRRLRLDVLLDNLPAQRLYQRLGFRYVQRLTLYYEDTGYCDFDLYEYLL